MKKIIIIIFLTNLCLINLAQETRYLVYHKDCPIFVKDLLDKVSRIDSVIAMNAREQGNAYSSNFFQPLTYSEFIEKSNYKSIPRRSLRIYYKLSSDLKTIYIMGITQNHLIQRELPSKIESWNMWNSVGENEFISQPKFVIPLQYYPAFVSQTDYDFILTTAEDILENNIAQKLITLQHDTIVSAFIDSLENIASYDDGKIQDMLNETSWYRTPKINSKTLLTQKEIKKFTSCTESWGDTTVSRPRTIEGVEISFEFNITRGKFNLMVDTAVSKLQMTNNFIGIKFKACNESEFDNTIWMSWADFFKGYNDPIFEQAITYRLNDYLFKKLINN